MNIKLRGPFIKSENSTSKMMFNVTLCLVIITLFSFYKNGILPYINDKTDFIGMFYPIFFVLTSTLTTQITEIIYGKIILKKNKNELLKFIKESYGYIPGLFLGLMLPINTPIYALIFGSIIAIIVGKMIFGGFGNNIFNPALIGALFITATYSLAISNAGGYLNSMEVDTITHATPLSNVVSGIGTYDTLVKPYGSLFNFFIGTIPGAVGETSALLCILGFIFLTITKTIKPRIPIFYISTVFILTSLIGIYNGLGIWYPIFQILSGGLFFGSIFMATDPVTSPTTNNGQILYGISLGILTVTFRYLTSYPEGVMTSILTMNMIVFILDKIGATSKFDKKKFIIPLVLLILAGLTISYSIADKYKNPNNIDIDFNIISKDVQGKKVKYTVTEKGYESLLKGVIEIEDGKVISFEIIEQNDSFYKRVEDAKYIEYLINNQNNLDDVDTITGATYSSSGVLKMLKNTIKDYGDNYAK